MNNCRENAIRTLKLLRNAIVNVGNNIRLFET